MTRPFDPVAFLDTAKDLAKREEESLLRTAIGRAYYATFLVAREKTGIKDKDRVHSKVIRALKGNRSHMALGSQLDKLRRLRVVADYEMLPDNPSDRNWRQNWITTESIVTHILPKLKKI
jgi:hypothetical protein